MIISLVNDVDPVVEILSSEEGVDMPQEDSKLTASVSVRNNNGHIVTCTAVSRAILTSGRTVGFSLMIDEKSSTCNYVLSGQLF